MTIKKKVLIVAGAGSALDFGMPSVSKVNDLFFNMASGPFMLFSDYSRNLYGYLYEEIERYWTAHIPAHLYRPPNFEDILYVIYSLAATYPDGNLSSAFGAFVATKSFPDILQYGLRKDVDNDILRHLGQHLVDGLLGDFRKRCIEAKSSYKNNFDKLQNLFSELTSRFDVAILTTNYDDVLYQVAPGIETGFNAEGFFRQERIIKRTSWPCLLHLHGSVHFDMDIVGNSLHEIIWQGNLTNKFHQNSFGRSPHQTIEGQAFPMSCIIAGYGKTMQIQRRPYRTYYSELERLASETDSILFLGYGFGDAHLNIAFNGFYDDRDRCAVVVDWADDNAMNACGMEMDSQTTIGRAALLNKSQL